jgi:imidazolonepropionase-like amidohydrolase
MTGDQVRPAATCDGWARSRAPLLAGTDGLNPKDNYDQALHAELQKFVAADIPPLDVLCIATQQGALAVGAEDLLGTLEASKLVNVVLLDANPMDDIANALSAWRLSLAESCFRLGSIFLSERAKPSRLDNALSQFTVLLYRPEIFR